jgi:hypothetical protein
VIDEHPQPAAGCGGETGHDRRHVVDALQARTGTEIHVTQSGQGLRHGIAELLAVAQHAGTVRDDIQIADVMALLTSTRQGAPGRLGQRPPAPYP